jgi:hypothetical protein
MGGRTVIPRLVTKWMLLHSQVLIEPIGTARFSILWHDHEGLIHRRALTDPSPDAVPSVLDFHAPKAKVIDLFFNENSILISLRTVYGLFVFGALLREFSA